jgi:hypothetical protein
MACTGSATPTPPHLHRHGRHPSDEDCVEPVAQGEVVGRPQGVGAQVGEMKLGLMFCVCGGGGRV